MQRWKTTPLIAVLVLCAGFASAEEPAEEPSPKGSPVVATLVRLTSKTLGGEQFWADEFIRSGWRIQRNTFDGHYRLLDANDCRHAVGDYKTCRTRYDELSAVSLLSPSKTKVVVLMHGLFRSRDCMVSLGDHLAKEGDFEIVNVTYPSTRAQVREHASSLDKVLSNLEGVEEVNFVAHSLGNVVVRHWLHAHYRPEEASFKLGRFVMLGPPNNGAQLARTFKQNHVFGFLAGASGKQLGENWGELSAELSIPPCEFGIVAGISAIPNPLVNGSDDLLVSVEETKLAGAADFRVLPVHHSGIRSRDAVGEITLHFLQHGAFGSEDERIRLR